MSKKNEFRTKKRSILYYFRNLAITKRITLLYGGLFSISLLVLSIWFCFIVMASEENDIRQQLEATLLNIENYVDKGGTLNHDALRMLLDNEYIEANVYSCSREKGYTSHGGNKPMFIGRTGTDRMRNVDTKTLREMLSVEGRTEMGYTKPPEFLTANKGDLYIHTFREYNPQYCEFILEETNNQRIMLLCEMYGEDENQYYMQVYKLLNGNRPYIRELVGRTLLANFIGILAAFFAGSYISRLVLQPVERIRATAERISIEDLSERIDLHEPDDEMRELSVTFNSMIERLEKAFYRQNQFVSDASHELRTPISIIQGYANLINRWGKNNPGILEESIDSILSETEHMNTLIQNLLFLAKSDHRYIPEPMKQISLNNLAKETIKELEFLKKNRTVVYEEVGDVFVEGDEDLLKQLLWIYVDNALKYTAEDGKIYIRVWKDEVYGYVSVADNGIGIADGEKEKIFDRFYREDKSRNKEIVGTGLGLSIAQRIVKCHKGQVEVESKQGKGSRFVTRFSLCETPSDKE